MYSLLFNTINEELIWNSQLIARYKEMSPGESYIWNWQSSEWTLCFSMWSMRKSKEFTLSSASFKCKIHLVTFLYILLLVDCFQWALIDCIEKQRVHSELCQFQTGGVYRKIHLVTFLFIFLLDDCCKWATIDCIEKQRVHSELCQFQTGGYIIRFTWWHFFISSY